MRILGARISSHLARKFDKIEQLFTRAKKSKYSNKLHKYLLTFEQAFDNEI